MRYIQDRPAYNHLGNSQDSNLTNPNPNPNLNLNPLTLLETVVRIRTNETHHSRKSPCTLIPKIIIISVGRGYGFALSCE